MGGHGDLNINRTNVAVMKDKVGLPIGCNGDSRNAM